VRRIAFLPLQIAAAVAPVLLIAGALNAAGVRLEGGAAAIVGLVLFALSWALANQLLLRAGDFIERR
jgi:hypothetical protein